MTISYRTAIAADAARVAGLARDTFIATFGHLYAPADLATFLAGFTTAAYADELGDPAIAVRLAEAGGEAIGFAKLRPPKLPFDPSERRALELGQLYLRDAWHGQGVAQHLMDWVIDEARRRGAQDVWLSVFTGNHRARAFYRRIGFVEVMPYIFRVGNHDDEDIICRLAIDGGAAAGAGSSSGNAAGG